MSKLDSIRHCCVFDLETGFIRKGCRRTDTPILEIGAVFPSGATFQTFSNPFLDSPLPLYEAIVADGKIKVSSTLSFWHTLLFGATARGTDIEVAAKVEAELLQRQVPSTKTALNRFEDFIIEHAADTSRCALVAHNGSSFDFKVMDGNAMPGTFWQTNDMHYIDSYRNIARVLYPDRKKFGLAPLHRDLVGGTFKHHRALDDSKATLAVLEVCARDYAENNDMQASLNAMLTHLGVKKRLSYTKRERTNPVFKWVDSAVSYVLKSVVTADAAAVVCKQSGRVLHNPLLDLRSIPNVGPKTESKLHDMGIHSVAELIDMRREHGTKSEFVCKLRGIYRYKKLADYVENKLTEA